MNGPYFFRYVPRAFLAEALLFLYLLILLSLCSFC